MKINKVSLLFIFSLPLIGGAQSLFSQQKNQGKFTVDGVVYGYYYNPSKKLLQKEEKITLEGALKNVEINVYEGSVLSQSTKTNAIGEFKLDLKLGKNYRLEVTKQNYSKSIIIIDLETITPEYLESSISFHGLELILNSYINKDTLNNSFPFAKLYYNDRKKQIDFEPNKQMMKKGVFVKKDADKNTSIDLLKKSVQRNKDNFKTIKTASVANEASKNKKNKNGSLYTPPSIEEDSLAKAAEEKKVYVPKRYIPYKKENYAKLSKQELEKKRKELINDRIKLERDKLNARTAEDSVAIIEAEAVLNARTAELKNALMVIKYQDQELIAQRRVIYLVIISSVLLLGFLVVLFKSYRDKRKTSIILEAQNKKITDSINYAKRIQESILLNDNDVKNILPESFVFFQPRDIVSGDFYWVSKVEEKIIIAAVDCTGHGVPGAFLSLIGNTLLNEIIIDKKNTSPAEILRLLHLGVMKLLHQNFEESKSMDGMELSICAIDKGELIYAGALSPIYLVNNDSIEIIEPDVQSIGGMNYLLHKDKEIVFNEKRISITKGSCLYLFTDGYMDQFGGEKNKKFNTSNFKKMLLSVHTKPVNEQKVIIQQTFSDWKGTNKQMDDVLIIGVKL